MTESHCTQILDKKIFKHLDSLRENHSYSNSDGEVPPTDQYTTFFINTTDGGIYVRIRNYLSSP
jgi:hypothetical protein